MTDLITIGKTIVETGSTLTLLGVFASLAIPKLRKKIWGMNGNSDVKREIKNLEENHLHGLEEKIDHNHEIQNALLNRAVYLLEDIKEKIK